jgi:D-alanyl-D-alanine carboxypeptidase
MRNATSLKGKPYTAKALALKPVTLWTYFLTLCLMITMSLAWPRQALGQDLSDSPRYAAIVVDAQSGEVFYAMRADQVRYPASLTKIMTLFMAFDALATGQIKPDDLITISSHAASQSPVKVGLRPGDTITVDMAMRLVAAFSANDLAAALGEHIGGSETRFAALMTVRAQELGMTKSNFVNASGLPDVRQVSSARDMAVLARAIMRDYPQYYEYFHVRNIEYRGRTYHNHNPLLAMPGVDGMKTGFIKAAGYNLVASQRKGDRRLISVMLGGSSKAQRREHVASLMNIGFDVIDRRTNGETITVAQNEFTQAFASRVVTPKYQVIGSSAALLAALDENDDEDKSEGFNRLSKKTESSNLAAALIKSDEKKTPTPAIKTSIKTKASPKKKDPEAVWAIQVGAFKEKSLANNWLKDVRKRFVSVRDAGTEITRNDSGWYRSRFVDMTQKEARAACKAIEAKRLDCQVVKG